MTGTALFLAIWIQYVAILKPVELEGVEVGAPVTREQTTEVTVCLRTHAKTECKSLVFEEQKLIAVQPSDGAEFLGRIGCVT